MRRLLLLFVFVQLISIGAFGRLEDKPSITGKGVLNDIRYVSPQAYLFYHADLLDKLNEIFEKGGVTRKEYELYSSCLKIKELLSTKSYTEAASFSFRKLRDEDLPLWLEKMLAQVLTVSYFKMGMLDKGEEAQEYYYSLVRKREDNGGKKYTEYMLPAEFYFDAKEYQVAADKYKESYNNHLQLKEINSHFLGFVCNNLALCYLELKEYDSVMVYTEKAREYWWLDPSDPNLFHYSALLDANIAAVKIGKGKEDEAIPLLYSYMRGCEFLDYHHYVRSFVELANVYVLQKKYDKAQHILDSLDKEVKLPVVDSKVLMEKYFMHYRIMNRKGEYDKAENFLSQYLKLSQEKFNESKQKELKQYALLFDIHEKQKELEARRIKLLENEQIRDEQRITLWTIVAVSILILALLIILFLRYKYQKRIVQLTVERKEIAEKALRTRETMLREVHHRIKNNLNTINGLFHLQLKSSTSPELKEQLQKSANRVFSIAEIHNMLYDESFLENVDMEEYLNSLCSHLLKTSNDEINFTLEVEQLMLNMDYALPIGLVVNELFTNSIKHAFKDVEKGDIKIVFTQTEDGMCCLEYSDNGPGYDIYQETNSLGLKLILMMKKQLQATIIEEGKSGTHFKFQFRVIS